MTAQGPMAKAVADALKAAQIPPRDGGGVALIRRYAQLLDAVRGTEDETETFDKLGPKLLAGLTALGMTAAGRAVKGGGQGVGSSVAAKLDEFTERRTRKHGS